MLGSQPLSLPPMDETGVDLLVKEKIHPTMKKVNSHSAKPNYVIYCIGCCIVNVSCWCWPRGSDDACFLGVDPAVPTAFLVIHKSQRLYLGSRSGPRLGWMRLAPVGCIDCSCLKGAPRDERVEELQLPLNYQLFAIPIFCATP